MSLLGRSALCRPKKDVIGIKLSAALILAIFMAGSTILLEHGIGTMF
jgi:hypothetical protein